MSKLDSLIAQISLQYKELKKAEFGPLQMARIGTLKPLCLQARKQLDNLEHSPKNIRLRKQVQDIQKKIDEVQAQIIKSKSEQSQSRNSNRYGYDGKVQESHVLDREQISKRVMRTIVMEQIRSSQLNISNQQLQSIMKKMQNNLEVAKDINELVEKQGGDLETIQKQIHKTYQNVVEANKQLVQADRLQIKGMILKVRVGVAGFLGALGWKIFGIPGMIVGLFTGIGVTR